VATIVVITAWKSSGTRTEAPKAQYRAPAAKPTRVPPTLAIRAIDGSSYVLIHRNGPAGRTVFAGTIDPGPAYPFSGRRLWIQVSAPENLLIKVRGRQIRLDGHKPRVIWITPTGWH
jgi:hypothetical protein